MSAREGCSLPEARSQSKSDGKREAIRRAALKVIADLGFHNATADLIAREAGVAVGTIYNYFKSKDEILEYIFEVERAKRLAFYERVRAAPMRPMEKVEGLIRFHLDEMRSSPDTARVFVQERRLVPCRASRDRGRPSCLSDILVALLEEGRRDGSFRKHDPELVAEALAGATEAVISRFVATGDTGRLDEAAEEIVRVLRSGIESPETSRGHSPASSGRTDGNGS